MGEAHARLPLPNSSSTMPNKNWIGGVTREQRRKDFHEAESSFEGVYPRPDHLNKPEYLNGVNVAVIGGSGQGKSSLICALLGITHDKTTAEAWNMLQVTNAAPKRGAAGETTQTAMPYSSVHLGSGVFLWDTPGAGTLKHPTESYIEEIGLKYFNGVLIVSQDRGTDVALPEAQDSAPVCQKQDRHRPRRRHDRQRQACRSHSRKHQRTTRTKGCGLSSLGYHSYTLVEAKQAVRSDTMDIHPL